MTKTIEDPIETTKISSDNEESPTRKRRKTAIDDGELVATRSAHDSSGLLHTEFTEPIDLTGISLELKKKMYAVAPILRGKEAVYTKEFFTDVVGLCGRGILVGKLVGFEEEIGIKWPVRQYRYEIVDCKDNKEAVSFVDHWSKVYGESLDNNYFSLRFLRGCYATLVHKMEVNWAQEALDRRHLRQNKWDKNTRKLGTIASGTGESSRMVHQLKNQRRNSQKLAQVATRCQVEGLWKIILELSCRRNAVNDFGTLASIQGLVATQEEERICANEVEATAAPLQETRLKLDAALGKMQGEDDKAEDALNAAYIAASKETKRLLREDAPVAEYAKKAAEMEELSAQLATLREADAALWAKVLQLESDASTRRAAHEEAVAALKSAQAQVTKARRQSLTLQTPRPFDYPTQSFVPPLGIEGQDTCAYCGLGFVWKAAVLSSCGCFLHAPCVAELMADQDYKCKRCKDPHLALSPIHLAGPWVAQFGGQMESHHLIDCNFFSSFLQAASKDGNIQRLNLTLKGSICKQ